MAEVTPLQAAEAMLGLVKPYGASEVAKAYRRESKNRHPDMGGTAGEFVRLKEARDLVSRELLKAGVPRKDPPRTKPKGETQKTQSAEWRRRQHRPWNTHDHRSRRHEAAGASFVDVDIEDPAEPDDSPAVELGDHIRVLHVFSGVVELVGASTWGAQIVARSGGVFICFQPPEPLERMDHERITCVFTLCNDDEMLSLDGPVVERCHDKSGRLTMFCADLLG